MNEEELRRYEEEMKQDVIRFHEAIENDPSIRDAKMPSEICENIEKRILEEGRRGGRGGTDSSGANL